ncbi:hypothetical protein D3C86_1167150 [compost metagenome]
MIDLACVDIQRNEVRTTSPRACACIRLQGRLRVVRVDNDILELETSRGSNACDRQTRLRTVVVDPQVLNTNLVRTAHHHVTGDNRACVVAHVAPALDVQGLRTQHQVFREGPWADHNHCIRGRVVDSFANGAERVVHCARTGNFTVVVDPHRIRWSPRADLRRVDCQRAVGTNEQAASRRHVHRTSCGRGGEGHDDVTSAGVRRRSVDAENPTFLVVDLIVGGAIADYPVAVAQIQSLLGTGF